jgi:hypothetical protein
VVVDDTNLRVKYVRAWMDLAAEVGASVTFQGFTDVPLDECLRRDAARDLPVGEQVIRDMHQRYFPLVSIDVETATTERYVPDPTLPAAWLVDVDGTLAIMCGRSPYDESRVLDDSPNQPVVTLVRSLAAAGWGVVVMSARTEACREDTEKWLDAHSIPHDALLMRAVGDQRRDSVVKRELFEQHVAPRWAVHGVLDDRRQVVEMWRSMGLMCAQVAPGEF